MIRVLIADDHTIFREMLRMALPTGGDIEVVAEAGDGQELVEVLYRARPDVLLLDYKMPHVRDFRALVARITARHPATRILILSGFATADMAIRAAEGGARGCALKSNRLAVVLDAIRAVAEGGVWIDPTLPRRVFDVFQRAASGPLTGLQHGGQLSRREREVLACVARGGRNSDIASNLAISEETVKTHMRRIFAKLGVKNRIGAALAFYGKSAPDGSGVIAAADSP
jgi:DNA-binding NarL/FixJ family response regulator